MSYEPRLIAPFDKGSGLDRYHKPWLIGDQAFEFATNMQSWRGMMRKRNGYAQLARFTADQTIASISNANPAVLTLGGAASFFVGTQYHIWLEGIVDPDYTDLNDRLFLSTFGAGNTFPLLELDGTPIDKSAAAAPAGASGFVYQPVQSLANRIVPNTLDEELIAFDQTTAWRILGGVTVNISFFQTTGAPIFWTGNSFNYYWFENFNHSLWVTNNVDPVRFYNGNTGQGWNNQRFQTNGTPEYVLRAVMIFAFKGRLLLLNTREGPIGAGVRYGQRARWSQRLASPYVPETGGDPAVVLPSTYAGAVNPNAWRDDIRGRGGFIDAATEERIVSAKIINDNIIVFFQRSTWRLRYTGNQIFPFQWERINGQLGSECTFGTVGFDQQAYTVSRVGFIGADTNNVVRVDQKIPDQAFEIETGLNMEEMIRVQATRDYYRNFFYWSYPDAATNARTPNRILSLNFDDLTWSIYDMDIRCFGRYKAEDDRIWANYVFVGVDEWGNQGDAVWYLGQDNFVQVAGGRDNGSINILFSPDGPSTDNGVNINLDLRTKRFNPYISQGKECRLQYFDLYTTGTANGQITLEHYIDANDNTPVETKIIDLVINDDAKYTRVFLGTVAEFHQLRFLLSDDQYEDDNIAQSPFELQGIVLWTKPEARIKSGALL